MIIYPAIDLQSGKCVRLYKGQFDKATLYSDDPFEVASAYAQQGAEYLHVVDLDGAQKGKSTQLELILALAKATKLQLQMGGGIRTYEQMIACLKHGISRVVLGSKAILQGDDVKKWLAEFGAERIVLALDVSFDPTGVPLLVYNGWQKTSSKSLWQLLDEYQTTCLKHVLCTDVGRDGTLQGPNNDLYQQCVQRYPALHFQASGGIHSLADINALANISVAGIIIGKALYESSFSLNDALRVSASC
ncbi:MAG: 1-(5-phosphoribosyl)-5-[(5-phosphoribosylamino)methylideneamino]imidazole-4-carboxamide isomerase [Gammaproteobacteria bacterium]